MQHSSDCLDLLRRVMNRIHELGDIWYSKDRRDAYGIIALHASNLRASRGKPA